MFSRQAVRLVLDLFILFASFTFAPRLLGQRHEAFATATVPFTFRCGTRVMPSGRYQFRMSSEHILQISGSDEGGFVMVRTEDEAPNSRGGTLLFQRGDGFELKEITAPRHGLHLYCASHFQKARRRTGTAAVATVSVELAERGR